MSRLIKAIFVAYLLSTAALGYAEEVSETFMFEDENGEVTYIDKKTSQPRSKEFFSMKRVFEDEQVIYKFTSYGEGDYDKYKDVSWDIVAEMEEKGNFLYPLYSYRSIKDKDAQISLKHERRFDYDKRRIYYTISDGEGNIVKQKIFPMKGMTVDSATMTYFLKTFVAHRDDKAYKTFYLISDKAELYRITLKVMGFEMLELPVGKIKAIKLRLIPNLGLLTGVIGAMIPPTFVWYSTEEPYDWLQYEGLETGLGSTHIVVYISTREPPLK